MKLTLAIILFCSLSVSAQNTTEFDGHKWDAPYYLEKPKDWGVERFLIPISFAPGIPYKGVEDIRFTPGWAKAETSEYWSYAFLWYLDSVQHFDTKTLENNLTAYYKGLFSVNTDKSKIDTTRLVPVTVAIQSKKTDVNDLKTFEGAVTMNDYMTKKQITLNLIAHVRYCAGQNKTFVFFELSPRPYSDSVWRSLNKLWITFSCIK